MSPPMWQLVNVAFKRSPWLGAAVIAVSILIALFEGVSLGLILPIVEGISTPEEVEPGHALSRAIFEMTTWIGLPFSTTALVLIGLVLFGLQSLLVLAKSMAILYLRMRVEVLVRAELFAGFFATRVAYFDEQRLGRLSNAVVVEATRTGAAVVHVMEATVTGILVAGYFVVAVLISWELALLASVIIVVGGTATRRTSALRQRGHQITIANAEMESTAVEYLSAIRVVNALGLQAHANDLFHGAAIRAGQAGYRAERFVAAFRLGYEIGAVAVTSALLGVGVLILEVETAATVAFFVLLFRLAPRIVLLQNLLYKFVSAYPGYEEVRQLTEESMRQAMPNLGAGKVAELRERIDLKDVSFSYDGETNVLEGMNLTIPRGATVGIVGVSGTGKSTLVDLLLRLADPTGGTILVDGTDLRDIDVKSWRSLIGFVGQETFLFHASIEHNLQLSKPGVGTRAVEVAADRAGVHEFIKSLPAGYETVVGERGAMLSGGQRQRLALARALVREPEILLLDEATSDLDSRSQALILQSIREMRGRRTVIIVAHRLSTVRDADLIIALDAGKVAESGTHDELVRLGGIYAEFHAKESSGA
jgi:ABC-type multidrug transport system fused ATPase/permease subunit